MAAAQLLVPFSSQLIIDRVIIDDEPGLLGLIMIGIAVLLAMSIVMSVVERYIMTKTTLRIDRATLDHVSGRLLDMPLLFFQARRTGDIERRLNGLREVRQLFLQQGVQVLTSAATLVVAIGLMLYNNVELTLVYLTIAPLYGLLMFVAARRLRPVFDSLEDSWGRYKSRQIDAIKGIDTVKAAGAEPQLRRLLLRQFDELAARLFRADFTMMLVEGALGLLAFVPLALIMWMGALQVLDDELSLGAYVSFIALVVLTTGPVVLLFSAWDTAQYAAGARDPALRPDRARARAGSRPLTPARGPDTRGSRRLPARELPLSRPARRPPSSATSVSTSHPGRRWRSWAARVPGRRP